MENKKNWGGGGGGGGSNWEFFVSNWEKNILFGIGNGAQFRPQNRVIKSPETSHCDTLMSNIGSNKQTFRAVIHLQFWAYGSWDSLFPISMSPTANL